MPHWNPTWTWATVCVYFETSFYSEFSVGATRRETSGQWQNTHTAQVQTSTQTGQTCLIYISHIGHNLNVFIQQLKQLALTFVFASAFQSWQVASLKLKMQWPCVFALLFPTLPLLSQLPAMFKIYQCVHLSHIWSTVCVISTRMQTEKHMVAMRQAVAWWSSTIMLSLWLCNMHWNVAHNCKPSAPTRPLVWI